VPAARCNTPTAISGARTKREEGRKERKIGKEKSEEEHEQLEQKGIAGEMQEYKLSLYCIIYYTRLHTVFEWLFCVQQLIVLQSVGVWFHSWPLL
jgi:hypothetical protein